MLRRERLDMVGENNPAKRTEVRKKLSETKMGVKNPMYGTISPGRKVNITEGELRKLYVNEGHNARFIAKKLNVNFRTIRNWLSYYNISLTSEQMGERRIGIKNGNYKGAKQTSRGYIYRPAHEHPNCTRDGYVMEHRLVIEKAIGRYVGADEEIHHINYNKSDNRIENLVLLPTSGSHTELHKYLERLAMYLMGILKEEPTINFEIPIFFAGKWISRIDTGSWTAF